MTIPLPVMPRLPVGALTLRAWDEGDAGAAVEAAGDPYIVATTSLPAGADEDDAADFVARQRRRVEEGMGYSFAIAGADGVAVGQVGVWVRELELGRVELGYWTVPSRRGCGVAAAALGAASEWALDRLGASRLHVFVEPWNAASIRTAESCRYVREGLLRSWREVAGERRDFLVLSRLAD